MSRFAVIPASAVLDTRLSPRDITVLCALGMHTDKAGWCWPSGARLGGTLGITRQAVAKSISKLRDLGYVQVDHRTNAEGGQDSNMMRVLFDYVPPVDMLRKTSGQVGVAATPPATSEVAPPATSEVAPPATSEVARRYPLKVPIERIHIEPIGSHPSAQTLPGIAAACGKVDKSENRAADKVADCPHERILELWREVAPMMRQPRTWSGNRRKWLAARWREAAQCSQWNKDGYRSQEQGLEFWRSFFDYIVRDTKLPKGFGDRDNVWMCDLEWIVRPQNFAKIIDGRYDK